MPPASSIYGGGHPTIVIEEFPQQELQPHARYQETEFGFLCLECHTIIKRKQDMVRHLETTAKHGERRHPCSKCLKSYTRPATLRGHICKGKKL